MNALIHTTFKIRVTSVTRVTMPAKHPDSLAFNPVTLQHAIPYTRCNARDCVTLHQAPCLLRADTPSHLPMAQSSLATLPTRRARDSALHVESQSHD
jgi:hypothetical protein